MPKRVYTFSNIAELKNAPYFAEIAALPQITMSREMAYHMVRSMRVFKGNVLTSPASLCASFRTGIRAARSLRISPRLIV